jgi:hypothetical protein
MVTRSQQPLPRILLYGAEKRGIHVGGDIQLESCTLVAAAMGSPCRFDDHDGVIVFNGVFERFKHHDGGYTGNAWVEHFCDKDELDARKKEASLLLRQKGFVCVLVTEPIWDKIKYETYPSSDLAKCLLNEAGIQRENFERRSNVTSKVDELSPFLARYGAAQVRLFDPRNTIDYRTLATIGNTDVSVAVERAIFFIPALLPKDTEEAILDYFDSLVRGLLAVRNRLRADIPTWADQFRFSREEAMGDELKQVMLPSSALTSSLESIRQFKQILVSTGNALAESVAHVMREGFGFEVEIVEEFKEDVKILKGGKIIALCEVKGTTASVKREYVNQADSHRERSGFPNTFPVLLVVNTHRSASVLADKDKPIPSDQVQHALRMNVLRMRSLDLLRLVELVHRGIVDTAELEGVLTTSTGWLKVEAEGYELAAG